jgi:hypothetical protein
VALVLAEIRAAAYVAVVLQAARSVCNDGRWPVAVRAGSFSWALIPPPRAWQETSSRCPDHRRRLLPRAAAYLFPHPPGPRPCPPPHQSPNTSILHRAPPSPQTLPPPMMTRIRSVSSQKSSAGQREEQSTVEAHPDGPVRDLEDRLEQVHAPRDRAAESSARPATFSPDPNGTAARGCVSDAHRSSRHERTRSQILRASIQGCHHQHSHAARSIRTFTLL